MEKTDIKKSILEIKNLVNFLNCTGIYGMVELELNKIEDYVDDLESNAEKSNIEKNTQIIPDYFYDKELCDAIRYIFKNSSISIENAELYMKYSNDYNRDIEIVKKLSDVGMSKNFILPVIKAMNTNKQ